MMFLLSDSIYSCLEFINKLQCAGWRRVLVDGCILEVLRDFLDYCNWEVLYGHSNMSEIEDFVICNISLVSLYTHLDDV